jgi:hypothetical protein
MISGKNYAFGITIQTWKFHEHFTVRFMFLTLHIPWIMFDISGSFRPILVPPGRYDAERVSNSTQAGKTWVVLKGTTVGLSEQTAWEMAACRFEDFRIGIETSESG